MATQLDGQTPLEFHTFGIEEEKAGMAVENESCQDCMNLETGKLPLGTDSVRMQATLMTAGAGLLTGVLWVAVLAG